MAEEADMQSVMRIGKRCFVGNLAWKTSWQDLKDKFREIGTVVYANVVRDDAGRSKGWGIVEFETPEEAVAAVNTFNGEEIAGRKILVREDREDRDVKQYNKDHGIERPEGARPPRRSRRGTAQQSQEGAKLNGDHASEPLQEPSGLQVVVQGIPWKYRDEDLSALFEDCAPAVEAKVVISKDGRSRGYGTVRFDSREDADKAVRELHSTELEGRTLTVKIDK
ncbi:G-strand telomere binding protein 1 [Coccomyxa subellipsoidea C-169]|uniref:G-strand telomere binding protein 1 n=1 Tax=Coccomyxa subellipsoidea (strain C-169) TaxID=574566 RepID=I0YTG3_COCSC|nr:G-strand telomere binding protein 1 [Coccomyxa subellipsoidea C-169]EIE21682.1 G-strand telomere binding protein 1 [Coccomyxa subellipsoidea C-169]|eukprot:XP_005646226.1 G-strand telomere binding protein 1 [Coccomyxa subellipsoidea C-169]